MVRELCERSEGIKVKTCGLGSRKKNWQCPASVKGFVVVCATQKAREITT